MLQEMFYGAVHDIEFQVLDVRTCDFARAIAAPRPFFPLSARDCDVPKHDTSPPAGTIAERIPRCKRSTSASACYSPCDRGMPARRRRGTCCCTRATNTSRAHEGSVRLSRVLLLAWQTPVPAYPLERPVLSHRSILLRMRLPFVFFTADAGKYPRLVRHLILPFPAERNKLACQRK